MIEGVVESSLLRRYRKLSEQFLQSPITEIDCLVVLSRESADHWIRLRHGGELGGMGIASWGAKERQRYLARLEQDKKPPALQVLDLVRQHGMLSPEAQTRLGGRWFTNLERLIDDTQVREKLGLELVDGQVNTRYDQQAVLGLLTGLIEKLALGEVNVNRLRRQEDRVGYINEFLENADTRLTSSNGEVRPISAGTSPSTEPADGQQTAAPQRQRTRPSTGTRKTLIPSNFRLSIPRPRTNNVFHELRKMNITDYPNAAAVMFRVLLDLSVTEYVRRAKLSDKEESLPNQKLRDKLKKTADYLEQQGIMTHAELQAVRHAAEDQRVIVALQTFNGFVHEPTFEPIPSDLKVMWDNLQPFIETIWRTMPE